MHSELKHVCAVPVREPPAGADPEQLAEVGAHVQSRVVPLLRAQVLSVKAEAGQLLAHLLLAQPERLATDERMAALDAKLQGVQTLRKGLQQTSLSPTQAAPVLNDASSAPLKHAVRAQDILARPHILLDNMVATIPEVAALCVSHAPEILEQVEIQVKYEGYIAKEQDMADKLGRLDHLVIPSDLDFHRLTSLSFEGRQKLSERRPSTLGEASRISGVSPSDLSVLMIYLGR